MPDVGHRREGGDAGPSPADPSLLPCPLCSKPSTFVIGNVTPCGSVQDANISCTECGLFLPYGPCSGGHEEIETWKRALASKWNTRPQQLPGLQGQLAHLKDEIQEVVAYTDMSISEFCSGEIEKKNIFAARYTLHMKAVRLKELTAHFAELAKP